MTDREWEAWGYPTKGDPCDVCGSKIDTKSEPRFYYVTCREHAGVPPVKRVKLKGKSG